jgi:hypothetical protein
MKHLHFLILGALFTSPSKQEMIDMFCKKWKYTGMESGDGRLKLPLPLEFQDSYITLKSDGTLTRTDRGEEQSGIWTYDYGSLTLTTNDNHGKRKQKIIAISDTEMRFRVKSAAMSDVYILTRAE